MRPVFKPGETFRGYVIERLLGTGGLGSVWLARHGLLDAQCAIKVLDREIAKAQPEYVKRFVREAKLASRIQHPHLVAVRDVGYDSGRDLYFLVMEYVEGDTLRMAIALGGPMPEAEAAGIVLQMADVLANAQRYGLVHRDLKPENVMITPGGSVKLLDLGVAKVSSRVDSLRTMADSVFGTANYIAPEQAVDSSSVDPRADIYSLGVILFELLAGRRPYAGDTPVEVLKFLLGADPVPDVRTFAPSVSPALATLVAKMCAKDPERRFTSPGEMIEAFHAAGFVAANASAAPAADGGASMHELLSRGAAGTGTRATALSDISLNTTDPEIAAFLARRKRRRVLRLVSRVVLGAVAALVLLALAARAAFAGEVGVADCARDPGLDAWAAADVRYAREVMKDVFEKADVAAKDLAFGEDGGIDPAGAEVVRCVFKTPAIGRDYDFPLQPLSRMHLALYATPERAKTMMAAKITEWPRMRVGYSPVSQGGDDDRERYFRRVSLSPEYVEFPASAQAVSALKAGEIDLLFLYTPEGRRPEGLVEVVPIGSRNTYFAVRKDRPELFDRLQKAYRECYIDNADRYDRLRERLLGVPVPANRVRVAAYQRGHLFALSPEGDRSGVIEDWFNAIAGHSHWSFDYVYGSYEESVADVMHGRLDVVGGLGFTTARSETLLYPHTPIGMLRVYLWTKRDSRFNPGDLATWKGMRVGILAGSFSAERVRHRLETGGNPHGIVCTAYPTEKELLGAYFSGEIDACVDIETPALNNERALHVYVSHPMYICVAPTRRDLFAALERALDRVCDDFPNYMRMIAERHYGIRDEMSLLTFSEAEWLKRRAADPEPVMIDFSPWPVNLRDAKGNVVHFAKEFLGALSRRTGLKFDPQEQTGIHTAEAKFLRGETKFWIPYPERPDVAAMGGVSVFALPVPKMYAHMLGADGENDTLEMWARRDVPEELVSVVRKAVSGMEAEDVQEMFIKAAAERTIARRIFGLTEAEFKHLLAVVGFAAVSLVAAFALVMILLLKRQVRRANAAAKVAEEYSRAKTRFLAMMSHELRTPLNAVIGFAEFLSRGDCDDKRRRDYINGIRLSSNALLDLINDILDLSKLDSGSMHMLSGECNVEQAAEELPAIFNYNVRRSGVPFHVRRTSSGAVPILRLSHQGLKQILINLVGNSAKFTERGEIDVEYGWDDATHTLSLVVRDTGCGISDEKMAHLFDPFVQDISSRMKHAEGEMRGTGLGLPIVKRMVDNAGGTVDVKSEIGKGTTFVIKIPSLDIVRAAPPRPAEIAARLPRRVLVVDDMAINRKVLGIHLKNLGIADVRFAENGVAALAEMKDWKPDVVLTDMWMPEMDGQQLAAAMKADPLLAGIPVMAITADVDVASTYDMSGFAKVIAKPVTSEKLRGMFA